MVKREREMFYLMIHSTHFIYGYMASDMVKREREINVLFNDTLNTFYLRLYGIRHMVKREREMFYLTTHSTHFIYGYMASDIWLRTILIVRKETHCRHIGYSYQSFMGWTHWAISCSSQCSTTGATSHPVCGMVHIKEPLLLNDKSSPCGGSGFPISLSE